MSEMEKIEREDGGQPESEPKPNGPEGLLTIGELLKNSWQAYKERKWTLLVMVLTAIVLPVLSVAPFVVLGVVVSPFLPGMEMWTVLGCVLLGTIVVTWFGNWCWTAFFTTIIDQACGMKKAFHKARPKILASIWLGVLTGFILTGAHMLLIIPGIILTVWFFFAPFILIEEDERGLNALLKSKEYVRGRWLPVALRLAAIWFLCSLIACIPVVGQLSLLFLLPLSLIYTHLLYKNLKSTRGEVSFTPSQKDKTAVLAMGTVGLVLPAVMVVTFMGSMALMPFAMLKASLNQSYSLTENTDTAPPDKTAKHKRTFAVAGSPSQTTGSLDGDLQVLKDTNGDWTKRSQAAFRLGQSKDKKAIPALVQAVKQDDQWVVRQNAIQALQKLQALQALPDLIAALESDENVFVRKAAAVALGKLGDKKAATALEKALLDPGVVTNFDNDQEKQVKAVAEAAREALVQIQKADKEASTVAMAQAQNPAQDQKQKQQAEPFNVAANKPEGISGKEAKQYRDMIEACNKAIKIQPNDHLAYHNRAVAHFKLGEYNKAIEDFTKTIKYNPKDALAYYNRAIVYGIIGNHEAAIADGVQAVTHSPQNASAYINRGIDYMAVGKMEQAVADFTKAIDLDTKDGTAYYSRAVAYQKIGSEEKANKDFLKASQLGDQKAKAYLKALDETSS